MSSGILLWGTITGYILSLDIVQDIFQTTYQCLSKLRNKISNRDEKRYSGPSKHDCLVSNTKIWNQGSKPGAIKTKKSILSGTRLGAYNGMVKKCVTGTLHFVFLGASIIIILFVPPIKYNSKSNNIAFKTQIDILQLNLNDTNHVASTEVRCTVYI